jgi:septal ring factor EnvC (AmiA/AmiB activator)
LSRHLETRLEDLEGELAWSRDLNEAGTREVQGSLSEMRADLARLKTDLAQYQTHQAKLADQLKTLSLSLSGVVSGLTQLESRMTAPRKIIRDEDGMITRVEVES